MLKSGPKTINMIRRLMWFNIDISNSFVYSVVNRLKRKGLLNVINVGRRRLYMIPGDNDE